MNVRSAPSLPVRRYAFLDLFRGLAVLLMIEGHLLRLVLAPEWKTTAVWTVHEFLHGFTGPAFLFGSGFAFIISLERKGDLLRSFTPDLWRRIGKAALLVLIGYALVVPSYSLSRTIAEATPEQWSFFFRCDALQLIGFTLLAMRLLSVVLPSGKGLYVALTAFSLALPLLSPVIWSSPSVDALPSVVSTLLTGLFGSPFPVFPFAAYLTSGALVSACFLHASRSGNTPMFFRLLVACGLVLVVIGLTGEHLLFPAPWLRHPDASPAQFVLRLGGVMIFLALSSLLLSPADAGRESRGIIDAWITTLGRESLVVYVCHLLLLYGSMLGAGMNIRGWFAASLSLVQSALLLSFFVVLLSVLSVMWSSLKKRNPRAGRTLALGVAIVWIVGFISS